VEGSYFINNAATGHEKESVMRPTVSVCRKGENLYLTLEGDFNQISSQQLLQALRKLVTTSLKCFAADSPVAFTFKTHGKVDHKKTAYV
jgi:hypothetical protein